MKILVTGGAGFIASQIADAYVGLGHQVTILDDFSNGKKANIPSKATVVTMDIRDPNIITLFEKSKFDVVNHHAAQIDVRKSVQDPFFDASVNILGTLRLLDCCRATKVKKLIFSSSGGTIYGECTKGAASETSPEQASSPYGFSKAGAELYIRYYQTAFGLPYTILRYGNVYGPRQDPHGEAGVVAIFVGRLLAGQPITIFGTGRQTRDYVHVADVVEANCLALLKGDNDTFNIGTGVPVSVLELHEKLSKIHGSKQAATFEPPRPGELEASLLDVRKAAKGLGWKPHKLIDAGLRDTYDYFRQHAAPERRS